MTLCFFCQIEVFLMLENDFIVNLVKPICKRMSTAKQKKNIRDKFLEFQINGLKSYRKYIEKELKDTPKTKLKKAYRAYLDKELARSTKRIEKLKKKLK